MTVRLGLALGGALALSACAASQPPAASPPAPLLPQGYLYAPEASEAASLAALLPQDDPAFAARQLAHCVSRSSVQLAET